MYWRASSWLRNGDHQRAFGRYETLLRTDITTKQQAAERFARAFAPKTRLGLSFRNLVVKAFAFPGLARLVIGRILRICWNCPSTVGQAQSTGNRLAIELDLAFSGGQVCILLFCFIHRE